MKKSIKKIVSGFMVTGSLLSLNCYAHYDQYIESHKLIYEHMENSYNFDSIKSDIAQVKNIIEARFSEGKTKKDVAARVCDYLSVTFYEKMRGYVPQSFDFDGEFAFLVDVIINGYGDISDPGMYDFLEDNPVVGNAACCIVLSYCIAIRNGYSPTLFSRKISDLLYEELSETNLKDFEKGSSRFKKFVKGAAVLGTFAAIGAGVGYSIKKYKNQDGDESYFDFVKNSIRDGAPKVFYFAKVRLSNGAAWVQNKWSALRN